MTNLYTEWFGPEHDAAEETRHFEQHPELYVVRPESFVGGTEHPLGAYLKEDIGDDNHCWASITDRASHLVFRSQALRDRFIAAAGELGYTVAAVASATGTPRLSDAELSQRMDKAEALAEQLLDALAGNEATLYLRNNTRLITVKNLG